MSAQEAADFMRVLRHNGALSRRTVALYVMPALTGEPDVREGTDAYRKLDYALGLEVSGRRRGTTPDEPLSDEAAACLHSLVDCVRRGNARRPDAGLPFNGFSREAYREVKDAIGIGGFRYLGIDARSDRLNPGDRRMREIREMELYAEDVPAGDEPREQEEPFGLQMPAMIEDSPPPELDTFSIPPGPDPFASNPFPPMDFGPDYEMAHGRAGMRKH